MLHNTDQKFGIVSRANHWMSAIIVISLIAIGLFMTELDKGETRSTLYGLHKSLGVGIFLLVILRLIWLKISPNPLSLSDSELEQKMANIAKTILYLGMILLPLSGWIMSNSGGHSVNFFQLFSLPMIMSENEMVHEIAEEVHELLANLMMVVIALHVLAAFKHHFMDKNATLIRMLGKD